MYVGHNQGICSTYTHLSIPIFSEDKCYVQDSVNKLDLEIPCNFWVALFSWIFINCLIVLL